MRHDERSIGSVLRLSVLAAVLLPAAARATTWRLVTVTCPLCGTKVSKHVPGSTYIPGTSPDGRPLGIGADMTTRSLVMCPKCGFTTTAGRFEKPEGLDKDKVRKALAAVKSPALFRELDRAMAVERNWTNNRHLVAHLALAAKWLADDTGEGDLIRQRLGAAIAAHRTVLKAGRLNAPQKAYVTYLIGELYRQAGDRKQAIEWLSRAEKLAPKRWLYMVRQQLFLARHAGKGPKAILEIAHKGTPGQKLAAIKILREVDDKKTIAFLKDFCLNAPKHLREPAIDALVGREPKKYHLPIFLVGLRNRHYRTVQRSARAVEKLGATEAAPIIVEVLKKPVKFTDARLTAALAAVATDKQVDFLIAQVGKELNQHDIFLALLQTRSPKAVPHVLAMIKQDRFYASYDEGGVFEKVASFGPELMRQLPDLRTAAPDDPLALLKIRALSVSKSPTAPTQLVAALNRGGDVAFHAALALAKRRSPAGKHVLLKQLRRVRSLDEVSITYLYSMLNAADFDDLHQRMVEEKEDRKRQIEERRTSHEKRLRDPQADEDTKRRAKRDLERCTWDEDWFMTQWVVLLAATRNPKARAICVKCLESPSAQLRAEAVKALAYVYDPSVGDILARRMPAEMPWVRGEVIRTIGKAQDKDRVDALVELVAQPTLIPTKLAWMETMMAMAPAKARPKLREWQESPNATLSEAAQQALARLHKETDSPTQR